MKKNLMKNLMLATAVLFLSACSGESQYDDVITPPTPKNPERREVLLNLNNKLVVKPHSIRSIATTEENTISTLDVYVFGSDTEDGTYTFQQRFAFRDDASGPLPPNSEELQLSDATADNGESITTGLLSLKRGLFVKLYCVANDTALFNPATGHTMKGRDFIPLTLARTEAGALAEKEHTLVEKPGSPTEKEFLTFHTTLLKAAGDTTPTPTDNTHRDESLLPPLAMSGAISTPLDLTDLTNSSRLQTRLRLTRLAARFDIVNDAQKSRFTITSVAMGNGRRGATFFPIAVCGNIPKDENLITYTARSCDGNTANKGLLAGAFYSYPSPQPDKGYLILNGQYKVNETENKEVSYQIPFRSPQAGPASPFLDINPNHRYTIVITHADDYHLDFTLRVEDWADDGNIDHYDPENQFDPLLVSNLLPDGETEYEPVSRTVTLCLDIKQECSFTVHTASNIQLKAYLDYPQTPDPKLHWLTLEEQTPDPGYEHQGSIPVKYKVSLDSKFSGNQYPRAVLHISDVAGIYNERVVINPQPYPVPAPTPSFTPSVANELNRFNAADTLLYLYRVTGSTLPIRLICADGVTPPENTSWYTIERRGGIETAPEFTLTLTDRSVALPEDQATLVFCNKKWPQLTMPMKVQLMEAELTNPQLETGTENATFDPPTQTITLKVRKDSKCKISVEAYKEAQVTKVEYEKSPLGKPSDDWVEYTKPAPAASDSKSVIAESPSPWKDAGTNYSSWTVPGTRSINLPSKERKEIEFGMKKDENIKYFGRAKVTVTNTCLGPDEVYYVNPEYLVPAITEAKPMVPVINNYDSETKTLYMAQQAAGGTSQASISVYAPGGSKLELPDGITAIPTESDLQTQLYTLKWTGTNDKETDRILTIKVINKSDPTKTETLTVKALASDISDLTLDTKTAGSATLSADKTTVTVDIVADNWFQLGMKAYGNNTRVSVISCPVWLKAGTPSPTRSIPVKEATYVVFTVDGTKTDFTEGDIVLKNPVGGPDLTIRVKPKYMKPSLSANPAGFSASGSWSGGWINMVQMRTGQATATAKIYSLGGSKGQIVTGINGLSMTQTAITTATNRDYPLTWAATNAALNDQTTTLRVYNFDSSQYLDIPVRLVSNGALDIKTNLGKWDPNPTMGGKNLRLTVGIEVPIEENKAFNMQVYTYGGASIVTQNVNWLEYTTTESNTGAAYSTQSITTFNFKVKSLNGSYTAKTFIVRPKLGGPDLVVTAKPLYRAPAITATNGMNPSINNWDSNQNSLYLLQKPQGQNSVATLTVKSMGGSKLTVPAGITASKTSSTNITDTYEIRWAGSNAVQSETTKSLRLMNNSDNSKYKDINVKLLPNTLNDVKITSQNGGISLSGYNGTNATLSMPIIKDRQFTISMQSYGGCPSVTKAPAWLQQVSVTRAAPAHNTYTFTYKLIENAANFNDTQFVFSNPGGGPAMTVNITRQFQAPTVTDGGGASPACNSFSGNTVTVFRTKASTETTHLIKVYSLGGSDIEPTGTTGTSWFKYPVEKTEGNHTKYYRVGHNNSQTNNYYNIGHDGVFNVRNAADTGKKTSINIHFNGSRPTFTSDYNCIRYNDQKDDWCYFDIGYNGSNTNAGVTYLRGRFDFYITITTPAGLNIGALNGFPLTVSLTSSTKNANGTVTDKFQIEIPAFPYIGGGATSMGELNFTSKDASHFFGYQFKAYNYHPIANGYFASLYDNNTGRYWYKVGNTSVTPANSLAELTKYPGWRYPSMDEWRAFVGWGKQGGHTDYNDEAWYGISASYWSNIFTSIVTENQWLKFFSNDTNRRMDIQRSNNTASYDIGSYGGQQRCIVIIAP